MHRLIAFTSLALWYLLHVLCLLLLMTAGWLGQLVILLALGPESTTKNGKRQPKEIVLKF